MLTLDSLSKAINGRNLFHNLGITVGDRSILHVKGGNGSGKTTLLKIIAGLIPADSGKIFYAKEDITPHYREFCDMINYVGHKNALNEHLTVYENLLFYARLKKAEEVLEAAMAYFALGSVRDLQVCQLSKGWQKKVALARLMLAKAEIWLLDEPFTNLDENAKKDLATLISVKCEEGGICIIASHDRIEISNVLELDLEALANNA